MSNSSIGPMHRSLPLRAWLVLGVMKMKAFSAFLKAPVLLKSHN